MVCILSPFATEGECTCVQVSKGIPALVVRGSGKASDLLADVVLLFHHRQRPVSKAQTALWCDFVLLTCNRTLLHFFAIILSLFCANTCRNILCLYVPELDNLVHEVLDEQQRQDLDEEESKYAADAIKKLKKDEKMFHENDGYCSDIATSIMALMSEEYQIVTRDKAKKSDCCK